MSPTYFNSLDPAYKTPFGAVAAGQAVTFRLTVPESLGYVDPHLVLTKDHEDPVHYRMEFAGQTPQPAEGVVFEVVSNSSPQVVGTLTTNIYGFASTKDQPEAWFGAGKRPAGAHGAIPYDRAGYTVRGAALSGIAAEGLEHGSGIASRTIASLEHQWSKA